MTFTTALRTI